MFFKYDFDEEDFRFLRLMGSAKRSRPDLKKAIPRLYKGKLPVSEAKRCDLLSLCKSQIIPPEHHPFYEALLVSSAEKDKLPEPDKDDSADDTD